MGDDCNGVTKSCLNSSRRTSKTSSPRSARRCVRTSSSLKKCVARSLILFLPRRLPSASHGKPFFRPWLPMTLLWSRPASTTRLFNPRMAHALPCPCTNRMLARRATIVSLRRFGNSSTQATSIKS